MLSLFKVLLAGIAPEERDAFKDQLLDLLSEEEQPGTTEAPDRRPAGADRRQAHDARLPRGTPSFAERFPNSAKVIGEGGAFDRRFRR